MSKKSRDVTGIEYIKALETTNVIKTNVEEEMKRCFISYAMAVNISRAIPDVRDGLKPVHRRILYAMGELNMYSDKPYRKCARIVGDVLGKYHPHGDQAVYDALVRLAQDFSIRCPLVDGQGNFGSVDGDPPAAQRYTEARLSKISNEMLRDIDKETVDYYPNFDETLLQPRVLPARFPNLLVNGADGIAVGMATNIPPHNLNEVIDGVIAQINNPDITIDELMEYIPAPDYPTGAIVLARGAIRKAYRTGRGGIVIRAKTEIEEYTAHGQQKTRIIITELPYQVNKAKLIENIADLVKDKKIDGISDINEESDRTGMRIVIEVKRDFNAQVVLNLLFKHTQLQVSNGIILLALADGTPKTLNLKEIIGYYIAHQQEVIVRRTQFDLRKAEDRSHILEGLVIAQDNIDKVVEIIRSSNDSTEAAERLKNEFELSDKQTKAILEMQLQRLTHLQVDSLKIELDKLREQITQLQYILNTPAKVDEIISTELTECKEKYGSPRRTEICVDETEFDVGDFVDKEDVVISLTNDGYIKRLPLSEYKSQKRGGVGVTAHKTKEDDFIERLFVSNTHDDLLFFTNKGKVYSIKAYGVPEAQKTARGRAIVNLLQIEGEEKVTAVIPLVEGTTGYMFMATKKGLVKKTEMNEFASIRKGGKIAIKLIDDDELVSVDFTNGDEDILIASRFGKCIRFSEDDVRNMGRVSQGVKSIKLDKEDYVVDMTVLKEGCQILTVSENGYGKRSDTEDYRQQGRAGKGIKAGIFNEKTGWLVNLKQVNEQDDIMLIADNGIAIRVKVNEISMIGRNTQGVKIMKFKNDAKLVCVTKCVSEDNEEAIEDIAEKVADEPQPISDNEIFDDEV
ncbi:MAG: DNA gyrase subunit A [Clostridia bacterium]